MFTFVSGNAALDLAGTVKARTSRYEDLLATPADLGDWIAAAGLLDRAPHCDAAALAAAVDLREACYRMAAAAIHGDPPADADRAIANAAARGPLPTLALRSDGVLTKTGDAAAALAAIARSALELLGTDQRDLVKHCGRDECTRLYVDTSRGHSRRWCDMTLCGNRIKSAAFRARHTGS